MVKANVDMILDKLREKKTLSLTELSYQLHLKKEDVQETSKYLEEDGVVKIEHKFPNTYLTLIKDPNETSSDNEIPPPPQATVIQNQNQQQYQQGFPQPQNYQQTGQVQYPSSISPNKYQEPQQNSQQINQQQASQQNSQQPGQNNYSQNQFSQSPNQNTQQGYQQQGPQYPQPNPPPPPMPNTQQAFDQNFQKQPFPQNPESQNTNTFSSQQDNNVLDSPQGFNLNQSAPEPNFSLLDQDPLDSQGPNFNLAAPDPTFNETRFNLSQEQAPAPSYTDYTKYDNTDIFPEHITTDIDKIEFLIDTTNKKITDQNYKDITVLYRKMYTIFQDTDELSPNEREILAEKIKNLFDRIRRIYMIEENAV